MHETEASMMAECTPKGVEIKIVRDLIRFHIEEQRMVHADNAERLLNEQSGGPVVTEDHAKALLAGEILHVETEASRVWPTFSLYKEGKQMFLDTIEEAIRDKETVATRVRERKEWRGEETRTGHLRTHTSIICVNKTGLVLRVERIRLQRCSTRTLREMIAPYIHISFHQHHAS